MGELLVLLGALLALEIIFPGVLIAWRYLSPAGVVRARLRVERTPWQCFLVGCLAAFILLPPVVTLLVLPLELTRIAGCFLLSVVFAIAGIGAAGLAARMTQRATQPAGIGTSQPNITASRSFLSELAICLWLGGVTTVVLLPALLFLFDISIKMVWPIACSIFFVILGIFLAYGAYLTEKRRTQSSTQPDNIAQTSCTFIRSAFVIELATGLPIIGWFVILPATILISLGAAVFALLRWVPGEAEPVEDRPAGIKRIFISSIALLWAAPFIAISVAVVAFFVRGGIPIELAVEFPLTGWLILIPIYVIVLLCGTVYALIRWRYRGNRARQAYL